MALVTGSRKHERDAPPGAAVISREAVAEAGVAADPPPKPSPPMWPANTPPPGARSPRPLASRLEQFWRGSAPLALRRPASRVASRLRPAFRALLSRFSSSLTRRILVLNLGGLAALLVGFLYLNQFREGLIDARVQSLQTQGEIIAAAIAASASVDTDTLAIDPEKLLQLAPGESLRPGDSDDSPLEFSLNPERIGPVLNRLVSPTRTRARIYDREGSLLVDSRSLTIRGTIFSTDLPAPESEGTTVWARSWNAVKRRFNRSDLPAYEDIGTANGSAYPEVRDALTGATSSIVRVNSNGETIVSVGLPVQRYHAVRGALLLSTLGGDIDRSIAAERWGMLRVFLGAVVIMSILSFLLAGTIANPVRRLAEASERVRRGVKARVEIPDFTGRTDEIGHLSGALRDMTRAMYARMEAIESFAADVAHELKNPLTSLRSAVETLPRVRSDESRARLLEVIQHDVRRLDRLISDISDASRLDAELSRADTAPVDLAALLRAVVSMANQAKPERGVRVALDIYGAPNAAPYKVQGHDSRLGQVITNLVDNARSFSLEGGEVRVTLRRAPNAVGQPGCEIVVDDDGPGIPDHAFERIFERFYTDRPTQNFGQNSGLGLSISRQIVEAHGGAITALNRAAPEDAALVTGARFTVWLPSV